MTLLISMIIAAMLGIVIVGISKNNNQERINNLQRYNKSVSTRLKNEQERNILYKNVIAYLMKLESIKEYEITNLKDIVQDIQVGIFTTPDGVTKVEMIPIENKNKLDIM